MANYITKNLQMVVGDTESFGFELSDSQGGAITLNTAYFSCKNNAQDSTYVFQKSLNDGITAAGNNQFIVRIAPQDTVLLNPGQYWYDLEIGVDDDIFTIFRGVLELVPEITSANSIIYKNVEWGNIIGALSDQTDLQDVLNAKADSENLSAVATSGVYNDLLDKPTIPTKTSDLTNDSKFVPSTNLANVAFNGYYYALSGLPTIPNKTSQLINDSNFVARSAFSNVAFSGRYSDLSDKPTVIQEYDLYETTGSYTTVDFTLSDSIMNYKKIGISYCVEGTAERGYTEFLVDSALSSSYHEISIPLVVRSGSEIFDIYAGRLRFAGNEATFIGKGYCRLSTSGISFGTVGCGVKKVIGFK